MKPDSQMDFSTLASELGRLRRRAVRQRRHSGSGPEAWQDWSATMQEVTTLTQRLLARPANDLGSLSAKFDVILWLIEVNESLLDRTDLRRLRRFGRDLSTLADAP